MRRMLLFWLLGPEDCGIIIRSLASGFDMKALEIGYVPRSSIEAGRKFAKIVGGKDLERYEQSVDGEFIKERTENA